jgi:hypothetical protein
MHATLIDRFPRLGMLWNRSNTVADENYFGIYDSPTLPPGAEKQFIEWEALLESLDNESLEIFLRKATGKVTAGGTTARGWSQLVDSINEVRGYRYAQSLGYTTVRLLNEQANPLPDIEASKEDEKCLIEVKTIGESDEELKLRGKVQAGESGLPLRLRRLLKKRCSQAAVQIAGHPWAGDARKICYLVINLDLRTLLRTENKETLQSFLEQLQTEYSVEIHSVSKHWPATS